MTATIAMIKQWIVAHALTPLIQRDIALRAMGDKPDKPYWADALAMRWGHLVEAPNVGWLAPWPYVMPYITDSYKGDA